MPNEYACSKFHSGKDKGDLDGKAKRDVRYSSAYVRIGEVFMTFEQGEIIIKLLRFIRGCLVAIIVSKGLLQIIKTQVRIIEVEDEDGNI